MGQRSWGGAPGARPAAAAPVDEASAAMTADREGHQPRRLSSGEKTRVTGIEPSEGPRDSNCGFYTITRPLGSGRRTRPRRRARPTKQPAHGKQAERLLPGPDRTSREPLVEFQKNVRRAAPPRWGTRLGAEEDPGRASILTQRPPADEPSRSTGSPTNAAGPLARRRCRARRRYGRRRTTDRAHEQPPRPADRADEPPVGTDLDGAASQHSPRRDAPQQVQAQADRSLALPVPVGASETTRTSRTRRAGTGRTRIRTRPRAEKARPGVIRRAVKSPLGRSSPTLQPGLRRHRHQRRRRRTDKRRTGTGRKDQHSGEASPLSSNEGTRPIDHAA